MRVAFVVLCALLVVARTVSADGSTCQKPPNLREFTLDKHGLERRASMINLWWTAGRDPKMPFEEAIKQRHADIDAIYSEIERERRQAFGNASCLVVSTKKCASTSGRRHSCPMQISPPPNMQFEPSTLQPVDDDFDVAPHLQGQHVFYTVKKTGAGSNTAGFQALAVFTPEYVEGQVKSALDAAHALLDPLLNVELGSSSTSKK